MIAVFPSADSATELPCHVGGTAPVPTSLPPCWETCALAGGSPITLTTRTASERRTKFRALSVLAMPAVSQTAIEMYTLWLSATFGYAFPAVVVAITQLLRPAPGGDLPEPDLGPATPGAH